VIGQLRRRRLRQDKRGPLPSRIEGSFASSAPLYAEPLSAIPTVWPVSRKVNPRLFAPASKPSGYPNNHSLKI
jgi:hypothetical protein